jgi:cytochrome P450
MHPEKAGGQIRKHFARAFSQSRVQTHSDAVRELAHALLTKTLRESGDMMSGFAAPLAVCALRRLLNIPEGMLQEIAALSYGLAPAIDCARLSTAELRQLDIQAVAAYDEFLRAARSEEVRQSACLSGLLEIARAHQLPMESVFGDLLFVLIAGIETTATLIGQIAWFVARNAKTSALIADNTASTAQAIEELMRLFPSLHIVVRRPTKIVELEIEREREILRETDTVLILLAAANRDPAVFDDPDEFRLGRPRVPNPLTFSLGFHHCIGATAARYEAGIALETLVRNRELRPTHPPSWRRMGILRALQSLELVELSPY